MNAPQPSAVPATNMMLKEDTSIASSSTSLGSSGVLKTLTGDVFLSPITTETTLISLSESLADLILTQIVFATQQNGGPSSDLSHQFIFLSPEIVTLEIQISDLLKTLETIEISEETSKNLQLQHSDKPATAEENILYQNSGSLISKSQEALLPQSQKQASTASPTFGKKGEALPSETSVVSNLSYRQNHNPRFSSVIDSLSKATSSKEQQITASHIAGHTLEKKEEFLTTTKFQELHKENRENKDQQKEGQHQQEEEQKQDTQNKKRKDTSNLEGEGVAKVPIKTLCLANLRYHCEIRQSREMPSNESSFKRKAPSPMTLFGEVPNEKLSIPIETPKIENVFLRFMKLMARILGQAEAEAHELYLRVKERTDNVDALTVLISKINNEKGDINWSNDPETKALVDRAKILGVPINNDNYTWSEEEKKAFKENIQMRKENMEKITQLERTDMQRHLQEVSQCHQARSNVLKLLKELMDTFTYNLRP
ncbi:hypothetical protein [Candidatus Chlamydia sanziniae]|uniref:Uncharacterized protein n=1 Tax=Candidatus Chlamydia sanziniae TaxID=1806891 RepID=A0A1A9HVF7_9CHLA|nr:hypothetical protein [Candidatus Chlamydia sanziniae]ANH78815.1 hypothetical protein Cs308_0645 [Candidatus Chlamydia sanziniae]